VSSTSGAIVNVTAKVNPTVPMYPGSNIYGTVTFTDTTNGTALGTGTVSVAQDSPTGKLYGRAVLSIQASSLAMGSNSIVATYDGDDNFAASLPSAPGIVTCTAGCGNGTGQTLTLAFYQSTPASHIISAGTTSTTPVSVLPGGGFTGAVNLTCSVTGTKSTDVNIPQCSFNPATVTITNTQAAQSTLTVTTTAPGTSAAVIPQDRIWTTTRYSLTLACIIFLGFSTRRRAFTMLRVVLCLVALGGIVACGGGGSSTAPPNNGGGGGGSTIPGTTPDTYTITFHAADAATGTATAQDYFTLQVN
jgi:hypothetical protein